MSSVPGATGVSGVPGATGVSGVPGAAGVSGALRWCFLGSGETL